MYAVAARAFLVIGCAVCGVVVGSNLVFRPSGASGIRAPSFSDYESERSGLPYPEYLQQVSGPTCANAETGIDCYTCRGGLTRDQSRRAGTEEVKNMLTNCEMNLGFVTRCEPGEFCGITFKEERVAFRGCHLPTSALPLPPMVAESDVEGKPSDAAEDRPSRPDHFGAGNQIFHPFGRRGLVGNGFLRKEELNDGRSRRSDVPETREGSGQGDDENVADVVTQIHSPFLEFILSQKSVTEEEELV